ncbi:MAG: TlpA family protein disulfide reductase [Gammaproteobacteria bacterium]|nr:TlpA family protein disulfide reductase [Gammaproteobacteria bacterium]
MLLRALKFLFLAGLMSLPMGATAALQILESRIEAPDFVLRDVQGKHHQLSALQGKVVVINFWATWCPPCLGELPSLQRLWTKYQKRDFLLLAVSVDDDDAALTEFVRRFRATLTFPVLSDTRLSMARFWPLKGLPTTFVLDKQGKVAAIVHGARRWDSIETLRLIELLMDEPRTLDEPQS